MPMFDVSTAAAAVLKHLLADRAAVDRATRAADRDPDGQVDELALKDLLGALGDGGSYDVMAQPADVGDEAALPDVTAEERAATRFARQGEAVQYHRRSGGLRMPAEHCSKKEADIALEVMRRTGCTWEQALSALRR